MTLPKATLASEWLQWDAFCAAFVRDGRVIDWQADARTVSEGQAYGLFFALVADDPTKFAELLRWSSDNLASGDVTQKGLAWLWGHDRDRNAWGVLDENPAADAEMFLAYTLIEAGRIWGHADYARLGKAVLERLEGHFLKSVGGAPVLKPGLRGFTTPEGIRTNPSYLAPFQIRLFAHLRTDPRWTDLLQERYRLFEQSARGGLPPDWTLVTDQGYRPDPKSGTLGSYDAIRSFLWEAMEPRISPAHPLLPASLKVTELGHMPEQWDSANGSTQGVGPPGFQSVMSLFARSTGNVALERSLRSKNAAQWQAGLLGFPARYYDQVLTSFVEGFRDGRFRFDANGRLVTQTSQLGTHTRQTD